MTAISANPTHFQTKAYGLFERFDVVSGADHSSFKNVGSESSAVSEGLQYAILRDALQVITWFTQTIPSTDGVADSESCSNEVIECDVTGFDVPSVFSRCEIDSRFTFDSCNRLLFNQRQIVPIVAFLVRFPFDEGPGFDITEISVTPKATSGDGLNFTALGHFDFGLRSSEDSLDSSDSIHT